VTWIGKLAKASMGKVNDAFEVVSNIAFRSTDHSTP